MPRKAKATKKKQIRKSTKQYVNKAINRKLNEIQEVRKIDTSITVSAGTTTPQIILVNGVGRGLENYQRTGVEVKAKYLLMKGSLTFPDAHNLVRVWLILDKQPNKTAFTLSDLLTFPTAPTRSFIKPEAYKRFVILHDKAYAGGSGGPAAIPFNMYKKLYFKTLFEGADNSIGNIITNALFFVVVSDSSLGPDPFFVNAVRFGFTDS